MPCWIRLISWWQLFAENDRQYELQALSEARLTYFLYNTLDTIIWMAEFRRVVQVTKSLATYFRLALNQGKDLIFFPVKSNHVTNVSLIQKQHMVISCSMNWWRSCFCPASLAQAVLQPLVENALYHGIKEKEGQGHIKGTCSEKRIQGLSSTLRMIVDFKLLAIVKGQLKRWGELLKCR